MGAATKSLAQLGLTARGGRDVALTGLAVDSRDLRPGYLFAALPGTKVHGATFVATALEMGATAILTDPEGAQIAAPVLATQDAALVVAEDPRATLSAAAALWFGAQPATMVAVTGTNGKTSATWWLAQALNAMKLSAEGEALAPRCAIVGTLGVGQPPHLMSTGMTTPDPVLLQAKFRKFVAAGISHCAIEASSIGLAEQRLAGTHIQLAMLTNFTQDHLDYHGSMAAYWQAKQALFAWPKLEIAVINVDDVQGAKLAVDLSQRVLTDASAQALDLWTCSSQGQEARLQARHLTRNLTGLAFDVIEGQESVHLQTSLMGDYNVDNMLGVIAALRALKYDLVQIVQICAQLKAVPGRMEKVAGVEGLELPLTVVDYAHTPDAVTQTLLALKPLADALGSQLWCVLGCGGDRDASKRPLMAAAAESVAHHLVLTSDNPRSELPDQIVQDMRQGLQAPDKAHQELDRAKAIFQTIMQAGQHDVILIAGKGHEDTQEIAGVKYPFDDRLHAHEALVKRANGVKQMGAQP